MRVKVSLESIKRLRELTGAGIGDAQNALEEAKGDFGLAQKILRQAGLTQAGKKSHRVASQGIVECYVHAGKVGVIVEVNCETDFVAKTAEFRNFAHEMALQIAAAAPSYIFREQVPAELVEQEKEIFRTQSANKKTLQTPEQIVAGKLEKFYEEVCLLDQPSIKDPQTKVSQMLTDLIAKLGENIVIRRFSRYQLGEAPTP